MTVVIQALELPWGSNGPEIDARIDAILKSWEGTPYSPDDARKGHGINCARLIAKFLDELYGFERAHLLPAAPGDMSLHLPMKTALLARSMREIYSPSRIVRLGHEPTLPGDILLTGPIDGGVGHGLIAGVQPSVLWHASPSGVVRTGVGNSNYGLPLRSFRTTDRELWNRTSTCSPAQASASLPSPSS